MLREGPGVEWTMRVVPELEDWGRRREEARKRETAAYVWGSREWGQTRRSGEIKVG
jgi:hypothetical protein